MPVYEYACACGHEFESVGSIKDDCSKKKCPKCGKKADQVFSKPAPPIIHGYCHANAYGAPYKGT